MAAPAGPEIRAGPHPRPAILCATDNRGSALLPAGRERRKEVPGDPAVAG